MRVAFPAPPCVPRAFNQLAPIRLQHHRTFCNPSVSQPLRRQYLGRTHATTEDENNASASAAPQQADAPEPLSVGDHRGPCQLECTTEERSLLWSATSRALLKLGKAQVLEKHSNSLKELVGHHHVVKVQLNCKVGNLVPLAEQLAADSGSLLLGVQGRIMLFGNSTVGKEYLLKHASEEAAKIRAYNLKRRERRQSIEARKSEAEAQPAALESERAMVSSRNGPSGRTGGAPSGGRGGNIGRSAPEANGRSMGSLDKAISRSLVSGPVTKDNLRKEWDNLSGALYMDGVAAAEEEMRALRTGRRPFGRGAALGGGGGRGGPGGRSVGGRGDGGRGARGGRGGRGGPGRSGGRGGGRGGER